MRAHVPAPSLVLLTVFAFACGGEAPSPVDPTPSPSSTAPGASSAAPSGTSSSTPGSSGDAGTPNTKSDPGPAPPACSGAGKSGASDSVISVSSGGSTRTSRVHFPSSYSSSKPAMLVLNFHGLSSNATQQEYWSEMIAASEKHGFVVLHPEGIGSSWNAGLCCGDAKANNVDDVAFVKALLAKVQAESCVDSKRIYATGMSNGGHFSYRLACQMSDVFAAVAPVAGQLLETTCNPTRPIPVLHIHGTDDTIVGYNGGAYRSVAQSLGVFQQRYGCAGAASTEWFQKGDSTCTSFAGCSAEVAHCRVDGGGHTWPGGIPIFIFGKTSSDLDATETIVEFFNKHPLP